MRVSEDGLVTVNVIKNISDVNFPDADFSIMNVPSDPKEAKRMFNNIYNMPISKHVCLALCRHRKKDRLFAMSNYKLATPDLTYLDTVQLSYEKATNCSNNGLLPISEIGVLYYKGFRPNIGNTQWFNQDQSNATTLWDLTPQSSEKSKFTYYRMFSWEIALLLISLSMPLSSRKFIYGFQPTQTLFDFCKEYNMSVQLYASNQEEAVKIIQQYEDGQ